MKMGKKSKKKIVKTKLNKNKQHEIEQKSCTTSNFATLIC